MSEAEAWGRRVIRLALNRQRTEAQVFLEGGFLYLHLRADGFARYAQGLGAEHLLGFDLLEGGVELRFRDGSALRLLYRLGRLRREVL